MSDFKTDYPVIKQETIAEVPGLVQLRKRLINNNKTRIKRNFPY